MPLHLHFILGTAAELIKVYPVIFEAQKRGHEVKIISTGQSRENFMMQIRDCGLNEKLVHQLVRSEGDLGTASLALKWFIRAMTASTSTLNSTSTSYSTLRKTSIGDGRQVIVVHGDTLSTLVGAWMGRRSRIPIAHIEAGLRSPSLLNPFPEEITRRIVSRLATYHFAPDETAANNLKTSLAKRQIIVTKGNTLADAVRLASEINQSAEKKDAASAFGLVNIHRFENLNSPVRWKQILHVLEKLALSKRLVFVAHPQTLQKLKDNPESLQRLRAAGIEIRERMSFSNFIGLLKQSEFLISDGGSNQEECSYLGKPCLLLREQTERSEGLGKSCVLSRFDPNIIDDFTKDPLKFQAPPKFPDQSPTKIILDSLENLI